MHAYGDLSQTEDPREKLARLAEGLRRLAGMPAGIGRHGALVAAFIEAGELVQGVADARFAVTGRDARSGAGDAAMALLMRLAHAVRSSWESGFAWLGRRLEEELRTLAAAPFPAEVRTKRAEGFALYSLYPEAYLRAALASGLGPRTRVIGIRSVGAPLAALVAAAIGAPTPVTVRPVGHPFRREIAVAEDLAAELLADPAAGFAVVDEGPGLSGSSFGAVADFLEDRGVAPDRIHFFPSRWWAPGPQASRRHRERWARARRHVVELGDLLLHSPSRPEHRLTAWVADLVGDPEGPLADISAGSWRALRYARGEEDWPAANVPLERRKLLLRARGATWLLRFAGLGREGARKLERARELHTAGFTPPVAGYRHGFLVERWIDGARSVDQGFENRDRLVAHLGRYLGFRARRFPAGPERGAPLAELWDMARHNAALALGESLARSFDRWAPKDLDRLERGARRVETDNRLHTWEWLALPDGRILKADAHDHHAAHDLVGCQDIAWDIAGAVVEFGLSGPERDGLCAAVEGETGRAVDPDLLALSELCYLAFQLGDHTLAGDGPAGWDRAEAGRLSAAVRSYTLRLRDALRATGTGSAVVPPC